jgi:hypothetical protein
VFVLYADDDSRRERIVHREGNDFGKAPAEFAWIAKDNKDALQKAEAIGAFLIDTADLACDEVVGIGKGEIESGVQDTLRAMADGQSG